MSRFERVVLFAGLLASAGPPTVVAETFAPERSNVVKDTAETLTRIRTADLEFPELHSNWFDVDDVPVRLRELEGSRIEVVGEMFPPASETVKQCLVILGPIHPCRFPLPREVYSTFAVKLKEPVQYTGQSVAVSGTFRIRPAVRNRKLVLLYWLEDATIRTAEKAAR